MVIKGSFRRDMGMIRKGELGRDAKIRKKILYIALILVILLLFLGTIKIFRIQYCSIWSESAIKSLNQYDKVLMHQQGWWGEPAKPLGQKDLIRLYFILGSTRKYRSEKHQKYLPDGKILKDPYIAFYSSKKNSNGAACLISWEYENNTLTVYENVEDEKKTNRYYIDKKKAQILHEMFEKYVS